MEIFAKWKFSNVSTGQTEKNKTSASGTENCLSVKNSAKVPVKSCKFAGKTEKSVRKSNFYPEKKKNSRKGHIVFTHTLGFEVKKTF